MMEVYHDPDERPRYPMNDNDYAKLLIVFGVTIVGLIILAAKFAGFIYNLIF